MMRAIRLVTFLAIGLVIGFAIVNYKKNQNMEQDIEQEQEISSLSTASGDAEAGEDSAATILKPAETTPDPAMPGVQIGGAFSLTDHNGKAVTEKDYAGSYTLVFFGFASCPEVCPTELQKMARALEILGAEKAAKIQPIFITVDPERDTPEALKAYVAEFHPKLVGLTGTAEQIEAVKKAYRVYATKQQMEGMDGYMMDHSAFTYLMGPDGANLAIYPAKDTAEQIAEDLKGKI